MNKLHTDRLRTNGYKLTPKREALLDVFVKEDRYLAPEYLWKKLKKRFKQMGLPSVYRNLEVFESCGILVKVNREDRKLYYALCPGTSSACQDHQDGCSNHHHILCVECGKVDDVDDCPIVDVKIGGYKVLRHTLQFEGLCSQCS